MDQFWNHHAPSAMRNPIKDLARQSKTAIVVFKIFDNWRLKSRAKAGTIETTHGSTHLRTTVPDSLAYIDKQFTDYLTYASLRSPDLLNKSILELGPGDNLGVALRFLAAGASSVTCLDRFYSKRDTHHEQEIYSGLRQRLAPDEKQRFDEAISLINGIELNPDRLQSIHGDTVEGVANSSTNEDRQFDLIVSCAVLEEIYDPDPTFDAMDKLLVPGGFLIHKIDLSDYGMFRNQGMHPLTFLTIAESIYKRMASDSGLPNRKRLRYYKSKMEDLGYDADILVTSVIPTGRLEPALKYRAGELPSNAGRALVRQVRNKLAQEFAEMDDDDLLIDGLLLVARKPV